MTNRIGHIAMYVAAAVWTALAASCAKEPAAAPEAPGPDASGFYIDLTLRMADGVRTRSADPDGPGFPAHEDENAIRSLHLFFDWPGGNRTVLSVDADLIAGSTVRVPLDYPLTEGVKIYLGANLDKAQIDAFRKGNEAVKLTYNEPSTDEGSSTDYDFSGFPQSLSPHAIGFSEPADEAYAKPIAMFCTKEATPKEFTPEQGKRAWRASFDLKRLVAKVLVTCKTDPADLDHAVLNTEKNPSFQGWMHMENIWYMVNSRNRKTYAMQKLLPGATDLDANVEDPNQSLAPYVRAATTPAPDDGQNYSTLINQDFFFVRRTEYQTYESLFRAVLPFDEGRLTDNAPEPYTEGIYCPENTFSAPSDAGIEEKLKASDRVWRMLTHVSIMARFTPRILQVEYGLFDYVAGDDSGFFSEEEKQEITALRPASPDAAVVKVTCPSECVAGNILSASLMMYDMYSKNGGEQYFTPDTYFYHEEEAGGSGCPYYTYGAARLNYDAFDKEHPTELGNYVPHLSGYGYYYTYIDNRNENNKSDAFTFYQHGQVERNRYYILTINSFSNPGSSIVNPNYIEVNTRTIDWLKGGSGEITLD